MDTFQPQGAADADPIPPSPKERESSQGLRFAAALVIQRAPAFLLLPLYARYLTPGEYGQLAILLSISLAGSFILSFGLETAILRNWIVLADKPMEREKWITTVATFLLTVPTIVAVACIAVLEITRAAPFGLSFASLVLALLGAALYATSTALPFALLRAQNRLRDYLVLSVVLGIGGALATTVGVVVLDAGVDGWLAGRLIGLLLTFVIALFLVPWPVPRLSRLAKSALVSALAFGLPLIPHLAAQWIMAASDRVILGGLVPDFDLGQYAVAATLCSGLLLLYSGLSQGSMPAYAHAQNLAGRARLTRVVSDQFALTALIGLAGAIILPIVVLEAFPSDYSEAADLCAPLALAYTLAGIYFIPMNTVTLTFGQTRWVWLASGFAALVNTVLVYGLGSSGGVTAAVFAPVASYAVLLAATAAYAKAVAAEPIRIEWRKLLTVTAMVLVVYALVTLALPSSGVSGIALRLGAVGAAGIGLLSYSFGFNMGDAGNAVRGWRKQRGE